jgi:hypothetical protein
MKTAESNSTKHAYGRPILQVARDMGCHLATMHRWRNPGVLDSNGIRRKLHMTRVGGRWYVTDDDLREFFDSLSNNTIETHSSACDRAMTAHQEDVERKLNAALGMK